MSRRTLFSAGHRGCQHPRTLPFEDEVRQDQLSGERQPEEGLHVLHVLRADRRVLKRPGQVQDPPQATHQLVRRRLRWLCECQRVCLHFD